MKTLILIAPLHQYGHCGTEDSFLVTGKIKHSPKKPFIATPAEMLTIIYEMTAGPGRIFNIPAVAYGK